MLILLPPSESKTHPPMDSSPSMNPEQLVFPELNQERSRVMNALITASGQPDAQDVLRVGARLVDEVKANQQLLTAPTAPAWKIYTGVLYDALDGSSLTPQQCQRAAQQVLIFSGLFGVNGFADPIPAYRLSMDVSLSPFGDVRDPGRVSALWKRALTEPLDGLVGGQLVVDCRSSSYAKVYRPAAEQTLSVNSFIEKNGQRKVVTHFAKHARGELTGMLLRAEALPESVDEIVEIASARWIVELRPAQGRTPNQLDLISRQ